MMTFLVYILYSFKLNRFYIGSTDDVERRLVEHNNVAYKDTFSTRGIPWEVFFSIDNLTSKQAFDIEAHIKKMKSSVYIKNLKMYPEMVAKLITTYS